MRCAGHNLICGQIFPNTTLDRPRKFLLQPFNTNNSVKSLFAPTENDGKCKVSTMILSLTSFQIRKSRLLNPPTAKYNTVVALMSTHLINIILTCSRQHKSTTLTRGVQSWSWRAKDLSLAPTWPNTHPRKFLIHLVKPWFASSGVFNWGWS